MAFETMYYMLDECAEYPVNIAFCITDILENGTRSFVFKKENKKILTSLCKSRWYPFPQLYKFFRNNRSFFTNPKNNWVIDEMILHNESRELLLNTTLSSDMIDAYPVLSPKWFGIDFIQNVVRKEYHFYHKRDIDWDFFYMVLDRIYNFFLDENNFKQFIDIQVKYNDSNKSFFKNIIKNSVETPNLEIFLNKFIENESSLKNKHYFYLFIFICLNLFLKNPEKNHLSYSEELFNNFIELYKNMDYESFCGSILIITNISPDMFEFFCKKKIIEKISNDGYGCLSQILIGNIEVISNNDELKEVIKSLNNANVIKTEFEGLKKAFDAIPTLFTEENFTNFEKLLMKVANSGYESKFFNLWYIYVKKIKRSITQMHSVYYSPNISKKIEKILRSLEQ